jgi:hypothetical protein
MLMLILAGLWIGACFVGMALLRDLQAQLIPFFVLYGLSFVGYLVAVGASLRGERREPGGAPGWGRPLSSIVGLAVLFRITLLFTTPPTLSSDVYRYVWDGRLSNAGVSPYAHAVNSPLLDAYDGALGQRGRVNNDWMASPYLPAAQALFATVYRLAPDSPLAFQIAAVVCDLLTGWMVVDLLRRLGLPIERALIYFWNPLLVVEVAHGAHVDAWMVCLGTAALWALVAHRSRLLSVLALVAATLTKGLPVLLLIVVARRWRARYVALYLALIALVCLPFAAGAGSGLTLPPDGTGLLGASLIYGAYWNFNSGLYHWLEVLLSGYRTPGPVPQEVAGWLPIYVAKAIAGLALGAVLIGLWRMRKRTDDPLSLLRWAIVPLVAYLLLTTTVHPWYLTWVLPLAPFLPGRTESERSAPGHAFFRRALAPLVYWTAVVPLTYLTYLDPARPREIGWVRLVEYVPLYVLLAWAAAGPWVRARLCPAGADALPCASASAGRPEPGPCPPGRQSPPRTGSTREPGSS